MKRSLKSGRAGSLKYPMRVLQVNKFFYLKGGSERYMFNVSDLLKTEGNDVVFLSMRHSANLFTDDDCYFVSNVDYEKKGIKNKINVSLKLIYSFDAAKKIERLIKDKKPDVAHLNNVYHQISPSIIHSLKKHNIPIVMTLHDYKMVCASYVMLAKGEVCQACGGGRYYNCFLKKCVKQSRGKSLLCAVEMYLHHDVFRIYDLVNIFIAPSEFLKNKFLEMGFKKEIVRLPYFVHTERYVPQYKWRENSIVYFGRISREKGIVTLMEAVKGMDVKLKIIGDGPMMEVLKAKARSGEYNNVYFLGYKGDRDLKDEIKRSMFVVVPSEWYENYPFSIIESFSLGKAVVGARIGGIPELVKDGVRGLTFEPRNADDLRLKIQYLRNNSAIIEEMGRKARVFVEEELNAPGHYQRLMKIYNRVLCG
jgi:glycosyltransferase involved in cell wall biosynthesis